MKKKKNNKIEELEKKFDEQFEESWGISGYRSREDKRWIKVPKNVVKKWFKENFRQAIKEVLEDVAGEEREYGQWGDDEFGGVNQDKTEGFNLKRQEIIRKAKEWGVELE